MSRNSHSNSCGHASGVSNASRTSATYSSAVLGRSLPVSSSMTVPSFPAFSHSFAASWIVTFCTSHLTLRFGLGFRRFSSTSLWNMSPWPFGVDVMITRLIDAIGFTMTAKTAFHTSF